MWLQGGTQLHFWGNRAPKWQTVWRSGKHHGQADANGWAAGGSGMAVVAPSPNPNPAAVSAKKG